MILPFFPVWDHCKTPPDNIARKPRCFNFPRLPGDDFSQRERGWCGTDEYGWVRICTEACAWRSGGGAREPGRYRRGGKTGKSRYPCAPSVFQTQISVPIRISGASGVSPGGRGATLAKNARVHRRCRHVRRKRRAFTAAAGGKKAGRREGALEKGSSSEYIFIVSGAGPGVILVERGSCG